MAASHPRPAKRTRVEAPDDLPETEFETVDDDAVAAAVLESVASGGVAPSARPAKRPRTTDAGRSLFVRSLPAAADSEKLAVFFSEHFPVKHATVVVDPRTKESRGYGFVTLSDPQDALRAKEQLDNAAWEGKRLRVDIAEPRKRGAGETGDERGAAAVAGGAAAPGRRDSEGGKRAGPAPKTKLIVRNLPWSIKSSEQLGALFRAFGVILSADLPQNKGKLAGFGFVTIRGKPNAERALEKMNGKQIDGRTIAVDWAVDKREWEKHKHDDKDGDVTMKGGKGEGDEDEDEDDDEWESDDEEGDGGKPKSSKCSKEAAPKKSVDPTLEADLAAFMKNHMENMEDEDEDDQDEDDDDDDQDEDEDQDMEDADDTPTTAPQKNPNKTSDNSTTAFVRNLPFTVNDDQLKTHFSRFGPVRYARVVMDKATNRPAGTGFVCFFNEPDLRACVRNAPRNLAVTAGGKRSILQDETADPTGNYTIDGRLLRVAAAVSKEEATRFSAEGHGDGKHRDDRRRLFLLNEGAVDTRSSLYKLLPAGEIKMRDTSRDQRRKLLQNNPSLHLSLVRLAVRNIPRDVTSKTLKELARRAVVGFATEVKQGRRQPLSREELARDTPEVRELDRQRKAKGKGIVRQCKVVYETRDGTKTADEAGGGAKSRGYGFIEYTSHRNALMGLRWLNGHQIAPEGSVGAKKGGRLIVEFAIENVQVVQRRKLAQDRARQRQQGGDGDGDGEAGGKKDEKKEAAKGGSKGGKGSRGEKDHQAAPGQRRRGWNESTKKKKQKNNKGKGRKKTQDGGGENSGGGVGSKSAAVAATAPRSGKKDSMDGKAARRQDKKDQVTQRLVQRKRVMKKKKATARRA